VQALPPLLIHLLLPSPIKVASGLRRWPAKSGTGLQQSLQRNFWHDESWARGVLFMSHHMALAAHTAGAIKAG
jgi:hypothetical protein